MISIIAADKIVDNVGSHEETDSVRRILKRLGVAVSELKIAPLRMAWNEPLPKGYLKGACSPLQAVLSFGESVSRNKAEALILTGVDRLRSDYTKSDRRRLMEVFDGGRTHLSAYDELAHVFSRKNQISKTDFREIATSLFENYQRTYTSLNHQTDMPGEKWFGRISEYFRGVDCANPVVDFSGCIIFATEEVAESCDIDRKRRVRVSACALAESGPDGPEQIETISEYTHIKKVFNDACSWAGIDFKQAFLSGKAVLEVYTCYPVVPIAFLLRSGLVSHPSDIPGLLEEHEITITGGLNLAKGPWNNTTLNTLVSMVHLLRSETDGGPTMGGIHGNGSLGYQQGFMILDR